MECTKLSIKANNPNLCNLLTIYMSVKKLLYKWREKQKYLLHSVQIEFLNKILVFMHTNFYAIAI